MKVLTLSFESKIFDGGTACSLCLDTVPSIVDSGSLIVVAKKSPCFCFKWSKVYDHISGKGGLCNF